MTVKTEVFQKELDEIFAFAEKKKLHAVTIKSGNLHRVVGEYPGTDHRMPICCDVMYKNKNSDDQIISAPPKGKGASLTIEYHFPR